MCARNNGGATENEHCDADDDGGAAASNFHGDGDAAGGIMRSLHRRSEPRLDHQRQLHHLGQRQALLFRRLALYIFSLSLSLALHYLVSDLVVFQAQYRFLNIYF